MKRPNTSSMRDSVSYMLDRIFLESFDEWPHDLISQGVRHDWFQAAQRAESITLVTSPSPGPTT